MNSSIRFIGGLYRILGSKVASFTQYADAVDYENGRKVFERNLVSWEDQYPDTMTYDTSLYAENQHKMAS